MKESAILKILGTEPIPACRIAESLKAQMPDVYATLVRMEGRGMAGIVVNYPDKSPVVLGWKLGINAHKEAA